MLRSGLLGRPGGSARACLQNPDIPGVKQAFQESCLMQAEIFEMLDHLAVALQSRRARKEAFTSGSILVSLFSCPVAVVCGMFVSKERWSFLCSTYHLRHPKDLRGFCHDLRHKQVGSPT